MQCLLGCFWVRCSSPIRDLLSPNVAAGIQVVFNEALNQSPASLSRMGNLPLRPVSKEAKSLAGRSFAHGKIRFVLRGCHPSGHDWAARAHELPRPATLQANLGLGQELEERSLNPVFRSGTGASRRYVCGIYGLYFLQVLLIPLAVLAFQARAKHFSHLWLPPVTSAIWGSEFSIWHLFFLLSQRPPKWHRTHRTFLSDVQKGKLVEAYLWGPSDEPLGQSEELQVQVRAPHAEVFAGPDAPPGGC